MKVLVDIDQIDLEGDYGTVPSIEVTCTRCGHSVEVYGRSENSIKRGCVMLKQECPEGEFNFYSDEEDSDWP